MSNVKIEFHFRGYYSYKKIKPTFGQFVGFSVSTDRNYDDNYSDIAVIAYEGPIESFNHGIEVIIKPFKNKVELLKDIAKEYQEEYYLFIECDEKITFREEHQKFFDDINCNIQFNPWWKSYWPDTMYKCLQKHFERGAAILVEDIISFYGKDIADDYIPLMIEKGYIKEFAKDVYYLPFRQFIDGIIDFTFPIMDTEELGNYHLPDYSINIVTDIIAKRFIFENGKRIGFFRAYRITDNLNFSENFIYTNKKIDYDVIELGGRKFNVYHIEKEINEDNYKDMFLEEIKKRKPKSIWDY